MAAMGSGHEPQGSAVPGGGPLPATAQSRFRDSLTRHMHAWKGMTLQTLPSGPKQYECRCRNGLRCDMLQRLRYVRKVIGHHRLERN